MNKRLLLIPVVLLSLSSCSNKKYPPIFEYRINGVYKTIIQEFFELHKEEIYEYYDTDDYKEYAKKPKDWHPSSDDLKIEYTWGVYDETYVVSMSFGTSNSRARFGYFSLTLFNFGERTMEGLFGKGIPGGKFSPEVPNFRQSNVFFVAYNNHNFYWLEDAYDLGLLDDKDVDTLLCLSDNNYFRLRYDYFCYDDMISMSIDYPDYDDYPEQFLRNQTIYVNRLIEYVRDNENIELNSDKVLVRSNYAILNGEDLYNFLIFDRDYAHAGFGYDFMNTYQIGNHELLLPSNHIPMIAYQCFKEKRLIYLPMDEMYESGYLNDEILKMYEKMIGFYSNGTHGYLEYLKLERYYYDFTK